MVDNFKVCPKILETNSQTSHKIIVLTLRAKEDREEKNNEKVKKFRYSSDSDNESEKCRSYKM